MAYYTLIASLPNLPTHFDVERLPLSSRALRDRLKLLREEDAAILQQLQDFLSWDRQPNDRMDREVVAEYERITGGIHNSLVLELIRHRTNIRTIVSGLRRRRLKQGPPIGVGELVDTIQRNFHLPHFGLHRRYPWIEGFEQELLRGQAVAGERLLFEETWQRWCRLAAEYTFSFEAVLLYVARWALVDRWTSRDAKVGKERFETLMQETLGEHAVIRF